MDEDFPELDNEAELTSVGVTSFALCEVGAVKKWISLSIPESAVTHHAGETNLYEESLPVTCRLPSGTEFVVSISA